MTRGAFTVKGDAVVWTCARCETENDLDDSTCTVCGAPFAATLREPEPERPARDAGTAALCSLFLPGAGHAYLGLWGQGVARAVISIWVVAVVLFTAAQGGPSTLIAVLFGLVAFALWGIAAHDAYREANGETGLVILKQHYFLYLVLGLLFVLILLIVILGLRA